MRQCNSLSFGLWPSQTRCFSVAVWFLLVAGTAMAAEAPTAGDVSPSANRADVPTESVVRELLKIQQRLGGSVVSNRDLLRGYPSTGNAHLAEPPAAGAQPLEISSVSPKELQELASSPAGQVQSLRDAAWQIDESAQRLERSDLYRQADALRELAQQFRMEARAIRARGVPKTPSSSDSSPKARAAVR